MMMSETTCLSGLNVLDISQGVAGPYCANILWQNGARVFKIEPPEGDWARHVGTSLANQSALSIGYNVGKKGICINAKEPAGLDAIRRMAAQCDVFVQNFRPGVVEKLGLAYDDLKALNPGIIYVSISGYGPAGPYALAPATDSVMQAETGIMSANTDEHGNPRKIGILMVDAVSGMYAAQQTILALYRRDASGSAHGEHIQLNLFDACAAFQLSNFIEHALNPTDVKTPVSAPNGVFNAKDGKLNVLALNNDHFARLCKALDKPEWLTDIRFGDNSARMAHRAVLHDALDRIIASKTVNDWVDLFRSHDVLHAPVRDYDQVACHPQAAFNQTVAYFEQGPGQALPYVFAPGLKRKPALEKAPDIGEHTLESLLAFGFDPQETEALLASRVIRQNARA